MKRIVMCLCLAGILAGCNGLTYLSHKLLPTDPCLTNLDPWTDGSKQSLAQCWDREDLIRFYTTSQGSQLVPYDLVMPLNLADGERDQQYPKQLRITERPLFTREHIEQRWGFLALEEHERDERSDVREKDIASGWPVGFAIDTRTSGKLAWRGEWLGLTCAACHTAQIEYQGKKLRVAGGPAMADIHRFLEDLRNSLVAVVNDGMNNGPEWTKYLDRYEQKFHKPENPKELLARLRVAANDRIAWHERNEPPIPAGYARLDAFGDIYNDALNALGAQAVNRPASNAPVSYPFLWDTSHHHRTQWNGISPPFPLGRNVGQVSGVFGKVDFGVGWFEDPTTVKMDNLSVLQKLVNKLRSPVWPATLGEIDKGKAAAGKELFAKRCLHCHAEQKRNEPLWYVQMALIPANEIRTDPLMAENANRRVAVVRDKNKVAIVNDLSTGIVSEAIGSTRPIAFVAEVLKNCLFSFPLRVSLFPFPPSISSGCELSHSEAYKGRPLDGIWATAPYLHNGSIPNLYYLLKPPYERPEGFCVGSREFDPVHVGFVMLTKAECDNKKLHWLDTTKEGNSNDGHYGHKYGGELSEKEIWQLIEYLKEL